MFSFLSLVGSYWMCNNRFSLLFPWNAVETIHFNLLVFSQPIIDQLEQRTNERKDQNNRNFRQGLSLVRGRHRNLPWASLSVSIAWKKGFLAFNNVLTSLKWAANKSEMSINWANGKKRWKRSTKMDERGEWGGLCARTTPNVCGDCLSKLTCYASIVEIIAFNASSVCRDRRWRNRKTARDDRMNRASKSFLLNLFKNQSLLIKLCIM